jgi:hypothetical protein
MWKIGMESSDAELWVVGKTFWTRCISISGRFSISLGFFGLTSFSQNRYWIGSNSLEKLDGVLMAVPKPIRAKSWEFSMWLHQIDCFHRQESGMVLSVGFNRGFLFSCHQICSETQNALEGCLALHPAPGWSPRPAVTLISSLLIDTDVFQVHITPSTQCNARQIQPWPWLLSRVVVKPSSRPPVNPAHKRIVELSTSNSTHYLCGLLVGISESIHIRLR